MNLTWKSKELLYKLALHNCTGKHLLTLTSTYETIADGINDQWKQLDSRLRTKMQGIDLETEVQYPELFITCEDNTYPVELLNLDDYPLILWYKGNLEALKNPKLSIVGSRAITPNTQYFLQSTIPLIVQADIAIVSGLAIGVDSYAHQVCVEQKGKAIAILGGGIDDESFSPRTNLMLRDRIISNGGLILTQFPPTTVPAVYTFPLRNKLVAALSTATLVAQAEQGSGTMITAGHAFDMEKLVCTPSVDYFEKSVSGNRELIQQGAKVMTQTQDILNIYFQTRIAISDLKNNNNTTLMSLAEIGTYFGIPKDRLFSELTMLEMSSKIERVGEDQFYVFE
jgi:DNA processing protein